MILRWFMQWESVDTAVEDMKEQVELVLALLLEYDQTLYFKVSSVILVTFQSVRTSNPPLIVSEVLG